VNDFWGSKEMAQTEDNNNNIQYMRGQYERLGYFLVASAFLVAGFVQLMVADTDNTFINEDKMVILIHAIAGLGSTIAAIYSFMNLWLWIKHKGQVVHTFIIPMFFLAFWLVVWYQVTHWCYAFLIVGVVILGSLILQRLRHKKKLPF